MSNRFDYIKFDDKALHQQGEIKKKFLELEELVNQHLADCRPKSSFMSHLEYAYMWVGKAIRDQQIARNGAARLQEERSDS